MAKKDRFELNKGGEHNFDLAKKGKRKFDLSKDDDELEVLSPTGSVEEAAEKPEVSEAVSKGTEAVSKGTEAVSKAGETVAEKASVKEPESVVPNVTELPEIVEEKKSNNAWMWVILILLILGLLAWWLWPAPKDTDEPTVAAAVENVAGDSVSAASEIDSLAAPAGVEEVAPAGAEEAAPAAPAAGQESTAPVASAPAASASASSASASASAAPASAPAASAPAVSDGTVEAEALNVIRGVYGNNPVRKEKLGARYAEIQKYVNQMKRNGKF